MERVPNKFKRIERSIRGVALAALISSCAPISSPTPMPESDLRNQHVMASIGTLSFPTSQTTENLTFSGPEPDPEIKTEPELKTEDDPSILDVPEVGKFRKTDIVLEGEASTYSRDGCLGCRPDRIMKNGKELKDEDNTVAVPPKGPVSVGSYVLVENITEPTENDPPETPSVVAEVTDTGGFEEEYGRAADLTLTTNHNIKGGIRGGGLRQLRVRLTLLEPIELVTESTTLNLIRGNRAVFWPWWDALAS